MNRYEVFDSLNEITLVVKARDHEEAAEKAVEKWYSDDDISLDSGQSLDVVVEGPLPNVNGPNANETHSSSVSFIKVHAAHKWFSVAFHLEPTYRAHEFPETKLKILPTRRKP